MYIFIYVALYVRTYVHLHLVVLPDMSVSGNTRRPWLSLYARKHIRHLLSGGLNSSQVVEALKKEGIQTMWRLDHHIWNKKAAAQVRETD